MLNSDSKQQQKEPLIKRGVGVSLVWRKKLSDRLRESNLKCFLIAVAWLVNYEFDEVDYHTLQSALNETDCDSDAWYEFEMTGSHSAIVRLARGKNELVFFEVNVPAELLPQLRLAVEIFTAFDVTER